MRISDLSRQTGIPIATIKFYLREDLIPPGTPTGRNQAFYDEEHLRRLRLIRAFTNIGQLDLSSVRELLTAIENPQMTIPAVYEVVDRALSPESPKLTQSEDIQQTRAKVDHLIEGIGWNIAPNAPGRDRIAYVMAALQQLGCECGVDFLLSYVDAAERLALVELDLLPTSNTQACRAAAVVRTILLAVAFSALRRMAQEHHAGLRFDADPRP